MRVRPNKNKIWLFFELSKGYNAVKRIIINKLDCELNIWGSQWNPFHKKMAVLGTGWLNSTASTTLEYKALEAWIHGYMHVYANILITRGKAKACCCEPRCTKISCAMKTKVLNPYTWDFRQRVVFSNWQDLTRTAKRSLYCNKIEPVITSLFNQVIYSVH